MGFNIVKKVKMIFLPPVLPPSPVVPNITWVPVFVPPVIEPVSTESEPEPEVEVQEEVEEDEPAMQEIPH